MRILVISQYYYPEPFRVNDICEELVRRGHEVFVVTGEPNYPEGEIYKGYEHHHHSDETINGVRVHRCPIVPRKTGTAHRVLNYYSYPWTSKRYVRGLMASDGKPFDVVFVNQLSPVMMAEAALAYRKKYNVLVLMYCLDLWPESLVAGGVSRKSIVYRVFHKVSKRIYAHADRILVTSRQFCSYFKDEFSISDVGYLPQYAEEVFEKLPYRNPADNVNLVFAGNIGAVQSVDTIIKAAKWLMNEPVRFHIVGGGTDLERIQGLADSLNNVVFYGRRPLEEMPSFYAMADAMLVTLAADPFLSCTLPGKVQSYMAAGKPIIGAINGEAADVIREAACGYCDKAEDDKRLAESISAFINNKNKEQLGINARRYYEENFSKETFMDALEAELNFLAEN